MSYLKVAVIYVVLLFLIFLSVDSFAYENNHDCDKHPIYCQIVDNKPTIKRSYAFQLSNIIYKKANKHNVDPHILTAIFAQESMYSIAAKNCTTGLVKVLDVAKDSNGITDLDETEEQFEKRTVCTDFGIGQIWYKTANSYDFDIVKLTTDVEYSVEAAAIVLKDFKNRYGHKEKDWWTRYNARNRKARDEYKELVERYINAD